jgi:hypothetical protein
MTRMAALDADDYMLTPAELAEYEHLHGKDAAASLLLLTPPDRFTGDYEETYARLTTVLTTK